MALIRTVHWEEGQEPECDELRREEESADGSRRYRQFTMLSCAY